MIRSLSWFLIVLSLGLAGSWQSPWQNSWAAEPVEKSAPLERRMTAEAPRPQASVPSKPQVTGLASRALQQIRDRQRDLLDRLNKTHAGLVKFNILLGGSATKLQADQNALMGTVEAERQALTGIITSQQKEIDDLKAALAACSGTTPREPSVFDKIMKKLGGEPDASESAAPVSKSSDAKN